MRFDEYRKQDATALARLIAKGELSAKAVLEVAIARAEQVNPAINAIVHQQYDRHAGRSRPGCRRAPLTGVPFLIKDLGFFETGEPATYGSRIYAGFVADHDSAYVSALQEAGLVFMGRSSSPEFGLSPNTEPRLYGACRNPWNLAHSAGGSSGGAAAAVIAGFCRWPTRPTAAARSASRPPSAACLASSPHAARLAGAGCRRRLGRLSVGHVLSRSVRDCALMLDCTAGYEPGDPYTAPSPERPFVEALARRPELKIALTLKDHRGVQAHPECATAVDAAAKLCASLGHVVEEAEPPIDLVALRPQTSTIAAANTARALGLRWKALQREPNPRRYRGVHLGRLQAWPRKSPVSNMSEAIAAVHAAGRKLAAFLTNYDVILSTMLPGRRPRSATST